MSRRLSVCSSGVAEAAGSPSLSRTNIFTGKGPLGWMPVTGDVAPGPHRHPSRAAGATCPGPTLSPPPSAFVYVRNCPSLPRHFSYPTFIFQPLRVLFYCTFFLPP